MELHESLESQRLQLSLLWNWIAILLPKLKFRLKLIVNSNGSKFHSTIYLLSLPPMKVYEETSLQMEYHLRLMNSLHSSSTTFNFKKTKNRLMHGLTLVPMRSWLALSFISKSTLKCLYCWRLIVDYVVCVHKCLWFAINAVTTGNHDTKNLLVQK